MDISAIALQGLQQANTQLQDAATKIASSGASSSDGTNIDSVDLAVEMIALTVAKTEASANLSALKVADQVQQSTLDIMA